jgi:hypothetical protein
LTFSFSELVYLSLIARLSWFGAVTRHTQVSYWPPDEDEEQATFCKLVAAEEIFALFEGLSWDVVLTIRIRVSNLPTATSRSKQMGVRYFIRLEDMAWAKKYFASWRSLDEPTDAIAYIDASRVKESVKATLGIT